MLAREGAHMNVILFGASGMVGRGVLRVCLLDPGVERVLSVVRTPTGASDPKLREIAHADFTDFSSLKSELAGCDACFFCLGVSAAGLSEADYTRITYDYTLAAARALVEVSPGAVFIYVSGEGTSTSSRSMWARVKGRTEDALSALPFKAVYLFRPGLIQPLHGIVAKTRLYRITYLILTPFFPLLRALFPSSITDNDRVARAMLSLARHGSEKKTLGNPDINRLGAAPAAS
jgi:uncharacterized protein YbjT (DUF2867 family)